MLREERALAPDCMPAPTLRARLPPPQSRAPHPTHLYAPTTVCGPPYTHSLSGPQLSPMKSLGPCVLCQEPAKTFLGNLCSNFNFRKKIHTVSRGGDAAQWIECFPSMHKNILSSTSSINMVHTPVILELRGVQAGGSDVQCYPQTYGELKASLGYTRPCHKNKRLFSFCQESRFF